MKVHSPPNGWLMLKHQIYFATKCVTAFSSCFSSRDQTKLSGFSSSMFRYQREDALLDDELEAVIGMKLHFTERPSFFRTGEEIFARKILCIRFLSLFSVVFPLKN